MANYKISDLNEILIGNVGNDDLIEISHSGGSYSVKISTLKNVIHPSVAIAPLNLTGANVLSILSINDTGHVTAATTRNLTPTDIGASPTGHNHSHNNLTDIQGGISGQYNHLSNDELNKLNELIDPESASDPNLLHKHYDNISPQVGDQLNGYKIPLSQSNESSYISNIIVLGIDMFNRSTVLLFAEPIPKIYNVDLPYFIARNNSPETTEVPAVYNTDPNAIKLSEIGLFDVDYELTRFGTEGKITKDSCQLSARLKGRLTGSDLYDDQLKFIIHNGDLDFHNWISSNIFNVRKLDYAQSNGISHVGLYYYPPQLFNLEEGHGRILMADIINTEMKNIQIRLYLFDEEDFRTGIALLNNDSITRQEFIDNYNMIWSNSGTDEVELFNTRDKEDGDGGWIDYTGEPVHTISSNPYDKRISLCYHNKRETLSFECSWSLAYNISGSSRKDVVLITNAYRLTKDIMINGSVDYDPEIESENANGSDISGIPNGLIKPSPGLNPSTAYIYWEGFNINLNNPFVNVRKNTFGLMAPYGTKVGRPISLEAYFFHSFYDYSNNSLYHINSGNIWEIGKVKSDLIPLHTPKISTDTLLISVENKTYWEHEEYKETFSKNPITDLQEGFRNRPVGLLLKDVTENQSAVLYKDHYNSQIYSILLKDPINFLDFHNAQNSLIQPVAGTRSNIIDNLEIDIELLESGLEWTSEILRRSLVHYNKFASCFVDTDKKPRIFIIPFPEVINPFNTGMRLAELVLDASVDPYKLKLIPVDDGLGGYVRMPAINCNPSDPGFNFIPYRTYRSELYNKNTLQDIYDVFGNNAWIIRGFGFDYDQKVFYTIGFNDEYEGTGQHVYKITIVSPGSGYSVGETISSSGGDGSGATGLITRVGSSGEIEEIYMTNNGTGYTSAPSLTINTVSGIGASLTAHIIDMKWFAEYWVYDVTDPGWYKLCGPNGEILHKGLECSVESSQLWFSTNNQAITDQIFSTIVTEQGYWQCEISRPDSNVGYSYPYNTDGVLVKYIGNVVSGKKTCNIKKIKPPDQTHFYATSTFHALHYHPDFGYVLSRSVHSLSRNLQDTYERRKQSFITGHGTIQFIVSRNYPEDSLLSSSSSSSGYYDGQITEPEDFTDEYHNNGEGFFNDWDKEDPDSPGDLLYKAKYLSNSLPTGLVAYLSDIDLHLGGYYYPSILNSLLSNEIFLNPGSGSGYTDPATTYVYLLSTGPNSLLIQTTNYYDGPSRFNRLLIAEYLCDDSGIIESEIYDNNIGNTILVPILNDSYVSLQNGGIIQGPIAGFPRDITFTNPLIVDLGLANNFNITLTDDTILSTPTNITIGQSGRIVVRQDTSGSRLMSFSTIWKFSDGIIPDLSTDPDSIDVLIYEVISETEIVCNLIQNIENIP